MYIVDIISVPFKKIVGKRRGFRRNAASGYFELLFGKVGFELYKFYYRNSIIGFYPYFIAISL